MFKPQFAPLVKSGAKRQTIRPVPKRIPKPGDIESWREWVGKPYRSPQRELAQVELTRVAPITFDRIGGQIVAIEAGRISDGFRMTQIALADGFNDKTELTDWFRKEYDLPFYGILISAKDSSAIHSPAPTP